MDDMDWGEMANEIEASNKDDGGFEDDDEDAFGDLVLDEDGLKNFENM